MSYKYLKGFKSKEEQERATRVCEEKLLHKNLKYHKNMFSVKIEVADLYSCKINSDPFLNSSLDLENHTYQNSHDEWGQITN